MAAPTIDIGNMVARFVLAAGIPDLTGIGLNIFVRDQPERFDNDPSPCCIIVVMDDSQTPKEHKTNSTNCFEYPVLVVLAKKGSAAPRLDVWRKEARYKLREILHRSFLLGKDGIIRRCRYNPQPDFETVGFTQEYKISGQMFVYRSEEYRGA